MRNMANEQNAKKIGAVMVVGAGVAGMQASLDLAESGYYVHLVDKSPTIGGIMAQLDKTFPTNDCAMCIISPKLVEVGRHLNINILPNTEVESVEGEAGNFKVTLQCQPRYIDLEACTACGQCRLVCPATAVNEFNQKLDVREATYMRYPQAIPRGFMIDRAVCIGCGLCEKVCLAEAVHYDDTVRKTEIEVGAVVLAPGNEVFDPSQFDTYNYLGFPNVVTSLEFERILSASGPYRGHLMRPYDREEPAKIAWLQCVGSRNINACDNSYCSAVCCMYAIKEAVIAKEHAHGDLDTAIFYMDMRTYGKEFEQYYNRAQQHGHEVEPARRDGVEVLRDESPQDDIDGDPGKERHHAREAPAYEVELPEDDGEDAPAFHDVPISLIVSGSRATWMKSSSRFSLPYSEGRVFGSPSSRIFP